MADYIITEKAQKDLVDIWNYTYDVWSENQADNYVEHSHTIGPLLPDFSQFP